MNGGDPGEDRALELYQNFHWGEGGRVRRTRKVPPRPRYLTELGKLEAVVYSTSKNDGVHHYEHALGEEGGRKPLLAADPESGRMHIVGGDYRIEGRGIVD